MNFRAIGRLGDMKHRKTNDVSSSIFLMNDLGKIAKTNIYIYIFLSFLNFCQLAQNSIPSQLL